MSDKTVLILGASYYQIDTIKAAKKLGYKVLTTDNNAMSPGHALADKSFEINTTDKDGILNLAISNRIDGIISPASDVAVPTVAFVAKKLGLAGPPELAVEIVCDKQQFRQFQIDHGLPTPKRIKESELNNSSQNFSQQLPMIIKPSRSSGGKGVYIVREITELYTRLMDAQEVSTNDKVIVEEYIVGAQGTAEGLMLDGEIDSLFVMDRKTAAPPFVTTVGHQIPSELPAQIIDELSRQISLIWSELKVNNGPFDCDFVVKGSNVYILEITPRIGGNSISRLLNYAVNFDIIENSLRWVCGELAHSSAGINFVPHALILFGVDWEGDIEYNEDQLSALQEENWVRNIEIDLEPNTPTKPFINSRFRVGECIVQGRDRTEILYRVGEVHRRLNIHIKQ